MVSFEDLDDILHTRPMSPDNPEDDWVLEASTM